MHGLPGASRPRFRVWPGLVSALAVFVVLWSPAAHAQSEKEVKTSGAYYVGEAQGRNLETVREEALLRLTADIQDEMSVAVSLACGESDEAYPYLRLQGVRYLEQRRKKNHRVVAFIAKEDFQDATADKVQCEVKDAELREQVRDPAAYLAYYKAYLRTFYSPVPIVYKSPLFNDSVCNIRSLLERRIRFFLANLALHAGPLTVDPLLPDVLTVPVQASYSGLPVGNIVLELNTPDGAPMRVVEGHTALTLYGQPSERRRTFPVQLRLYLGEDNAPPDLVAFHRQVPLIETRQLEIDFSNVIMLDFHIEREGDRTLVFSPVIEGLSAAVIAWDFGDGTTSSDFRARHRYAQDGLYTVTLTVNDSKTLQVTKKTRADGTIEAPTQRVVSMAPGPSPVPVSETPAPPRLESLDTETPETISALLRSANAQTLLRELNRYKIDGRLSLGNKSDFVQPARCYVFMIDPKAQQVVAILTPGTSTRTDLLSGKGVTSLATTYAGMQGIWVQVYF